MALGVTFNEDFNETGGRDTNRRRVMGIGLGPAGAGQGQGRGPSSSPKRPSPSHSTDGGSREVEP